MPDLKISGGGLEDKSGKRARVVERKVLSLATGKRALPSVRLAVSFGNSSALFLEAAGPASNSHARVQSALALSPIGHMTQQYELH